MIDETFAEEYSQMKKGREVKLTMLSYFRWSEAEKLDIIIPFKIVVKLSLDIENTFTNFCKQNSLGSSQFFSSNDRVEILIYDFS